MSFQVSPSPSVLRTLLFHLVRRAVESWADIGLRHEIPEEGGPSVSAGQSIQDRYHGRNDPVAKKILSTQAASAGLKAPEDQSIVSCPVPPQKRLIRVGATY